MRAEKFWVVMAGSADLRAHLVVVAGGLLAESLGPTSVAVAALGFPNETDALGGSDFFFDAAQIGPEFLVMDDAEAAIFEVLVEAVGKAFLFSRGEHVRLDFPGEKLLGAFGELTTDAVGIKAASLKL